MTEHPWEDHLLEYKLEGDSKDFLKTLVGFSNSVKPGHVAVLLIGETDSGKVQGVTNPDSLQKKIRLLCDNIYPPILYKSKVYKREGKSCLRVEVEYDGETPHFGAPAYVRKGSETIKASEPLFQKLIELRSGMVFELSKWINEEVSTVADFSTIPDVKLQTGDGARVVFRHPWEFIHQAKIFSVNSFWVTFDIDGKQKSVPLRKLTLSFDNTNNRLFIIIAF